LVHRHVLGVTEHDVGTVVDERPQHELRQLVARAVRDERERDARDEPVGRLVRRGRRAGQLGLLEATADVDRLTIGCHGDRGRRQPRTEVAARPRRLHGNGALGAGKQDRDLVAVRVQTEQSTGGVEGHDLGRGLLGRLPRDVGRVAVTASSEQEERGDADDADEQQRPESGDHPPHACRSALLAQAAHDLALRRFLRHEVGEFLR